jgi:hypothetical protein
MIKHFPITNTDKVCELYSEKDGVPVSYVCTTDIEMSDVPMDIFYRETPHPQFGNRYFAIYFKSYSTPMIRSADNIEDFTFGMVEDDDGNMQYSQSHHDYKSFNNGNMIDGGRQYIRSNKTPQIYIIQDGLMIEKV